MVARIARPFTTTLRGVFTAVGLRWRLFTAVAVSGLLLDILVPPLVLSLARKPMDFFTFNPWLKRLPDYLAAPQPPLTDKLVRLSDNAPLWCSARPHRPPPPRPPLTDKLVRLWDIALFWFSADGIFGVEWGFAVTTGDLARF